MGDENEIKRLERQLAKAEALIRQTLTKVEHLEASVEDFDRFKDRLVVVPAQTEEKLPVRVDRSKNIGDFAST